MYFEFQDIMRNIALDNLFLLDIETVSVAEHFNLLEEHWKELWTEKISRSLPANLTPEDYYPQRAAILAEFAKVVCISTGYLTKVENTWQLRIKSCCGDDEKTLLQEFLSISEKMHSGRTKWIFTGHNVKEFDIPFLCRRMLVNNLELPSFMDFQDLKPWETPILDTLHLWRFGDYKHYTSLKLLAAALGVPSPKSDIDGSMVGQVFWKEKDLHRITEYCERDVATVANIIFRFKNLPLLTDEQIVFVK